MSLVETLSLTANPFEHYTAEAEPDIVEYAVHPPYLRTILDKASNLSSFILFGERGAGKSATRITIYGENWANVGRETEPKKSYPLTVNIVDYSSLLPQARSGNLSDLEFVSMVSFFVIEKVLSWLSSLPEEDREIYINCLQKEEKALVYALLEGYYLNVDEMSRSISNENAFKLLNAAWTTKSQIWTNKRWGEIAKITSSILDAFSKKYIGKEVSVEKDAEVILNSLKSGKEGTARAILSKLSDLAQAFGFSGVCLLVDKLDETEFTSNSADSTAKLIYPILNHIQLMEVPGFSWIFFVWGAVKEICTKDGIRLDKISSANITWDERRLREMIETRIRYFSSNQRSFSDFFDEGVDVDGCFSELSQLALKSPRELIRLLDTILREHDALGSKDLVSTETIQVGMDKFVIETIHTWYNKNALKQLYRLGTTVFVNQDVQKKFSIGPQGARNKIINWQQAGMVDQDGTVPTDTPGKPVNKYVVADPRIKRIIERNLDKDVGADIEIADGGNE
ncbi:P-loop ATPase, Sll1717 family [Thalassospira sp. MCCC 1A03138]|uniref:P-loop ATPase, Sll1717 family n=1 Tax=Thalassospira sp. MCCC 1A03138 TaxID=1470576 RepID=UPI000A1DA211|nr:hypothetical protein [Thalassospira sp. MCCC 1A03138]OSQ27120.1 hypothetical protein TH468_20960 [Thalassospira sp. MCCC 1A03138]